jgi:DNA-binding NtrC family response regulator
MNKTAKSEKEVNSRQKEFVDLFNFEEEAEEESRVESTNVFFSDGTDEREEVTRGIDELFSSYSSYARGRDELSRQFRLKKEICWLFIEYFFTSSNIPLKEFMESLERSIILRVLGRVGGNQREAAKILGLKSTTLNEKIRKYKIPLR